MTSSAPSPDQRPRPASVRPMTAEEFDTWRASEIDGYARSCARSNDTTVDAELPGAVRSFDASLPDGRDTLGAWTLIVLDDRGDRVGVLWIGPEPERTPGRYWISDIEIDESRRGEGHGRAAMLAAEQIVRDAGGTEIGLNVFGFNDRARGLYDSLGYRVVRTRMAKAL